MNFDTFLYEMITWEEYYSRFIKFFEGWSNLRRNHKKRLTKKIRKFYWNQKVEMMEINKDRKNKQLEGSKCRFFTI
jgi:hypothetical protein